MVDINTYQSMHKSGKGPNEVENTLSSEVLRINQPPGAEFFSLLPANILGFHMQEKKWGSYPSIACNEMGRAD